VELGRRLLALADEARRADMRSLLTLAFGSSEYGTCELGCQHLAIAAWAGLVLL
jgi:hypothetical protein